jgi:hypothetical protein
MARHERTAAEAEALRRIGSSPRKFSHEAIAISASPNRMAITLKIRTRRESPIQLMVAPYHDEYRRDECSKRETIQPVALESAGANPDYSPPKSR